MAESNRLISCRENSGVDEARASELAAVTKAEWLMTRAALDPADPFWPALTSGYLAPAAAVKVICHQDALGDPQLAAHSGATGAAGWQVRITPAWVPDMIISDRRVAVLSANPAGQAAEAIWTEQLAVVSVLSVIFGQAWNAATPIGSATVRQSSGETRELVEAERKLLKLLANGATDESVARHLGISLRTARRHVAALMSHLAATSRFQAGAEAAKRGWLS